MPLRCEDRRKFKHSGKRITCGASHDSRLSLAGVSDRCQCGGLSRRAYWDVGCCSKRLEGSLLGMAGGTDLPGRERLLC